MRKAICLALAFIIMVSSLCACSNSDKVTDEMFALDTIITFSVYDNNKALAKETIDKCKREITRLEKLFSATLEGSNVYNINHSNGEKISVSYETATLIKRALAMSKSCDGAFDISVYPLVKLWGFDSKKYNVPDKSEITDALRCVNYLDITADNNDNYVTLKKGMSIDLGAVAKGYIAEVVQGILLEKDVHHGIINLGGLVVTYSDSDKNDEDFTIGIEYPDTGEVFAQFDTQIPFTVTSGSYQRFFEENGVRYHHIIDPKSGSPAESDISSVTVIGFDGTYCDALSTAFFVMGIDKTIEYVKTHTDDEDNKYSLIILSKNKDELYITSDIAESDFTIYKEFENKIKINVIDVNRIS